MKRRTLLKAAGRTSVVVGAAGIVGGASAADGARDGASTQDHCVVDCCCNCPSTCSDCECDFCCF